MLGNRPVPTAGGDTSFDPVLLAVISNRLASICREMEQTILRSGRSAVLNMSRDFSCAVVTGDGKHLASAEGIPVHVVGIDVLAQTLVELHPDLEPGDAFLHNDPYMGNTHPADHAILVPIFHARRHCFTAVVKAHQADCGNSEPTSYMWSARDVYHEGSLTFPCVQIQRGYHDVEDVIRMCRKRIRVPEQWYGDYLAMVGAARIAERRLVDLVDRYGMDTLEAFARAWFDYSERRVEAAIRRLPKGRVIGEGRHDSFDAVPEGIPLKAVIDIDPDEARIEIDLTDNPDCVPAGVNLSRTTAIGSATIGALNSLDPTLPHNAGTFRRIRVRLRENCVVGIPRFPASCSVATSNVADRVINLVQAAFAQLGGGYGLAEGNVGTMPGYAVISGQDPRRDGARFINQLIAGGGGGPAGASHDGWVTYGFPVVAGILYRDSVEVLEQKYPIRFRELRIWMDSEGAGEHRGGPGVRVVYEPIGGPVHVTWVGDGHESPPAGVRGGLSATHPGARLIRDDVEVNLPPLGNVVLNMGEAIVGLQSGGGGYGDPLDRDPRLVAQDVAWRWVSSDRARSVYGVVLGESDGQGIPVPDETATTHLRGALRETRDASAGPASTRCSRQRQRRKRSEGTPGRPARSIEQP